MKNVLRTGASLFYLQHGFDHLRTGQILFSRREKQTTFIAIDALRVNFIDIARLTLESKTTRIVVKNNPYLATFLLNTSAFYVRLDFFMDANNMNPDQTAPKRAAYCLQHKQTS